MRAPVLRAWYLLLPLRAGLIHKRLLLVAGAAGFRIVMTIFGPVEWATPAGILATNVFIPGGIAYAAIRERRVHPANWWGSVGASRGCSEVMSIRSRDTATWSIGRCLPPPQHLHTNELAHEEHP